MSIFAEQEMLLCLREGTPPCICSDLCSSGERALRCPLCPRALLATKASFKNQAARSARGPSRRTARMCTRSRRSARTCSSRSARAPRAARRRCSCRRSSRVPGPSRPSHFDRSLRRPPRAGLATPRRASASRHEARGVACVFFKARHVSSQSKRPHRVFKIRSSLFESPRRRGERAGLL